MRKHILILLALVITLMPLAACADDGGQELLGQPVGNGTDNGTDYASLPDGEGPGEDGDGDILVIPDFVGMNYESIMQNEEYQDIFAFDLIHLIDDSVPVGEVISQSPPADREREQVDTERQRIILRISSGTELRIPPELMPGSTSAGDAFMSGGFGQELVEADPEQLVDNHGNQYESAYIKGARGVSNSYLFVMDGRYSRFIGVIYVPEGTAGSGDSQFEISLDISSNAVNIYRSPLFRSQSTPILVDIDIRDIDFMMIEFSRVSAVPLGLAHAQFLP